jgi:hypothetical protein
MFVPQNYLSMKYIPLLGLFVLFLFFNMTAVHGQFYFGGGMKFNSNNEFKALGLNAKVGKDISEKFEINADLTYYIASKASVSVDFDLHYRLLNVSEKLYVSPMAGINITRTTVTNNSLSLGASFKVPTDKYTYFVEPRWILDNAQFVFSVGVLYPNIEW